MAFEFSFEDISDMGEEDGPSRVFSKAVGAQNEFHGSDVSTTSTEKTRGFNLFSMSEVLQGNAMFGSGSDVLDVVNHYMSGLLGGSIGIGGNAEGVLTAGFDNLIPKDIKDRAKTLRDLGVGKDVGIRDSPTVTIESTASVTTPEAQSGAPVTGTPPNITKGTPPQGVPRGPFPLRIVRTNNYNMVNSDVPPVQLNGDQILELLLAAGCDLKGAVFFWAISKRESHFIANIAGIDNNGGMGVGLWQITDHWPARGLTAEMLTDPWTNVGQAMTMSKYGTSFVPWQTSGNYGTPDGSHVVAVNMQEARDFFRGKGFNV